MRDKLGSHFPCASFEFEARTHTSFGIQGKHRKQVVDGSVVPGAAWPISWAPLRCIAELLSFDMSQNRISFLRNVLLKFSNRQTT